MRTKVLPFSSFRKRLQKCVCSNWRIPPLIYSSSVLFDMIENFGISKQLHLFGLLLFDTVIIPILWSIWCSSDLGWFLCSFSFSFQFECEMCVYFDSLIVNKRWPMSVDSKHFKCNWPAWKCSRGWRQKNPLIVILSTKVNITCLMW